MIALPDRFQLDPDRAGRGLSCDKDGVFLAGVPLLMRTALGFAPRTVSALGALLDAAYSPGINALAVARCLDVAAQALNAGDVALAMIAAVHLRLPELDAASAARLAQSNQGLAKYDSNEPRDWRGRWTTEVTYQGLRRGRRVRRRDWALLSARRRTEVRPGTGAAQAARPTAASS
jgi:hypothetical protein